jgi:hypothetical protein
VSRKATDFYKLILCTAILLKLFMVPRSVLVECFGPLRYKTMSFTNRDSLTSSFPICIPLISSCYVIALTRNCKTMLNMSGGSGHPCVCPDIRENVFSFPHLV